MNMTAAKEGACPAESNRVLGRNVFRLPKVLIVITHFNNSQFLAEALESVKCQSYRNLSCVIVDDCSQPEHFKNIGSIVHELRDERFKVLRNSENMGQIEAFYRAFETEPSVFVCVLDPDDRQLPSFVEEMVSVHLNDLVYAPMACCDQYLGRIDEGAMVATHFTDGMERLLAGQVDKEESVYSRHGFHRYFLPTERGWHWSTTSSMMFRSAAVRLIRPRKTLGYKVAVDAYLAGGLHLIGGSLLLRRALVFRGIHDSNDFLADTIFSPFQRHTKEGAVHRELEAKCDAVEAFLKNGGLRWFSHSDLSDVLTQQFTATELSELLQRVPKLAEVLSEKERS